MRFVIISENGQEQRKHFSEHTTHWNLWWNSGPLPYGVSPLSYFAFKMRNGAESRANCTTASDRI
jgi:hypothetical protein